MAGEMANLRKYYSVPAKRGMRVRVYSTKTSRAEGVSSSSDVLQAEGVISSSNGSYFWLKDTSGSIRGPYHPKYGVVYLDKDGSVLLDTRTA